MFTFLGKIKQLEDNDCDCGNYTCIFLDRDCEELQECGEIPYCQQWLREDRRNIYFLVDKNNQM